MQRARRSRPGGTDLGEFDVGPLDDVAEEQYGEDTAGMADFSIAVASPRSGNGLNPQLMQPDDKVAAVAVRHDFNRWGVKAMESH